MCNPLPGDRCASDTRQTFEETLEAYERVFGDIPDRPMVGSLVSALAMRVKPAPPGRRTRAEKMQAEQERRARVDGFARQLEVLREQNPSWTDAELQAAVVQWRDEQIVAVARHRIAELDKLDRTAGLYPGEGELHAELRELSQEDFELRTGFARLAPDEQNGPEGAQVSQEMERVQARLKDVRGELAVFAAKHAAQTKAMRELEVVIRVAAARQGVPREPVSPVTTLDVPVRQLRAGQILSTGETVQHTFSNFTTPKGKLSVVLERSDPRTGEKVTKIAHWNASTLIKVIDPTRDATVGERTA